MEKIVIRYIDENQNEQFVCVNGNCIYESAEDEYIRIYNDNDMIGIVDKNIVKIIYKTEKK